MFSNFVFITKWIPHGEGMQGLGRSSITGSCGRGGKGWQRTNGSPVSSLGQLQIGLWLMTRQTAFSPQTPGQGSLHFWLIQANDWEHSAFDWNSNSAIIDKLKNEWERILKFYRTLRAAARRNADESGLTRTNGFIAHFSAGTIWSTGWWNTGPFCHHWFNWTTLDRNRATSRGGITRVARETTTDWIVIDNSALSVQSTDPRAWINAPVVSTTFVPRTVRVLDTFWSTSSIRISHIVNWAFACGTVSLWSTFCSNTTRWWIARIFRSSGGRFRLDNYRFCATNEWITRQTSWARTYGIVIFDDTISSNSARAWTWVNTFLINTGFVLWTVTTGHAFGTARCSIIAWQARAYSLIVDWSTFSVIATWTWIARLRNDWIYHNWFDRCNIKAMR